jgi:hypothetical protein
MLLKWVREQTFRFITLYVGAMKSVMFPMSNRGELSGARTGVVGGAVIFAAPAAGSAFFVT